VFVLAWILIIAMIAVNALYVAAEFSAVSVRHSRIRGLAEDGNARARRLLPRIEDPEALDRYVACSQVGITFSSLVLGAVGQSSLTLQLGPLLENGLGMSQAAAFSTAAVVVLLCLTAAQMVLGELAPKSLALQFPTQTALATVYPMIWSLWLFSWFIAVLNGSGSLILRLMGSASSGHRHIHSPEEIELLIVESRDGGLLEPEEQYRLHQALRLSQRPASQLMVARLHMATIDAEASQSLVLKRAAESPYSRFPVVRGSKDNVLGVLYIKDVIARYLEHGELPTVTQMMRPMLTAPRTVTADRLLALFREHRCQQAILVDEYGGIEGLVTLEDVLTEVFGDFADEFKRPDREPERLGDGRVRAPGLTRLDDLSELLEVNLSGDAATVGGLVLNMLGRMPTVGEKIEVCGVEIEVEAVSKRTVTSVLVTPPPSRSLVSDDDEEAEAS
jgi:CBS domain containing-hemolysin-like protein